MIAAPLALVERLRPVLLAPSEVAGLLGGHEAFLAFRRVVLALFPDEWREILDAEDRQGDRESARVWAFCRKVEERFFPVYDADSYEQVAYEIPFVRNAWSFDRYHEMDAHGGELLLLALCAPPFLVDAGARTAILDAAEALVPRDLLIEIPGNGLWPDVLHERLDGTPYEGAALFADWLIGDTGSAFLDLEDEVVLSDAEWSGANVAELTRQWREATRLLDRVGELTRWLEADPPRRFARLLDAALDRDAHAQYLRERKHYELEITPEGLVPVRPDDPAVLALPDGAAA